MLLIGIYNNIIITICHRNPRKKSVINIEFKKVTNLLATIGALFYAVGDFKNCELMYVKYVKFIETNFGSDHL